MSEERDGLEPGADDLDEKLQDDVLDEAVEESEEAQEEPSAPVEPVEPASERPAGRQGRGPRDLERLRAANRELRERLARIEGRLEAPRPATPAQPDPAALAAQEAQRWREWQTAVDEGRMTPLQVMQQVYQAGQQNFQQQLLTQQFTTRDLIDRQAYEAQQGTSKLHREYAPRVEEMLRNERASGNLGTTRAAILAYLVGQDAIARAQAGLPAARRQAAARMSAVRARPGGARGDGAAERGSRQPEAAADEALLRGIRVEDL